MKNNQDVQRMNIIQQVMVNLITNQEAAEALGLSVRSIQRLKRKASVAGIEAVLHGNRGKVPHNAMDPTKKEHILHLCKTKLLGYNYAHARDVLQDEYGITVSRSSLETILKTAGIASPKQKRRKKSAHVSRKRRMHFGELVQIDASQFDWFGTGQMVHLHGVIDDATGRILGLYFDYQETLQAYVEVMAQMNEHYGLPLAIYSDGRTVFHYDTIQSQKVSPDEQLCGVQFKQPNFKRACSELGIALIRAMSPQAKGRIERLWGTLQDRLAKDLQRKQIHTIQHANSLLPQFIARLNEQYAVPAAEPEPVFLPPICEEELYIRFAQQEQRTLNAGLTFSFKGNKYTLNTDGLEKTPRPGTKITVCFSDKFGLRVLTNNLCLSTTNVKDYTKNNKTNAKQQVPAHVRSEPTTLTKRKSPWYNFTYGKNFDKRTRAW